MKLGLLTITGNYILSHLLIVYLGARGLALAYSLTGFVDMTALLFLLRRKIGPLGIRKILISALKTLVAAAIMGLTAYFIASYFEVTVSVQRKLVQLAEVLTVVSIAAGVYFGLAKLLKMEEVDIVFGILLKRFKRSYG